MKSIISILFLLTSLSAYAQVSRTVEQFVPTGAVMAFALNNCPSGWLKADGKSILKTNYNKLTSAMGNIHGNGSTNPTGVTADTGCPHATNCINLPDYRGKFLRMLDGGAGNDPDRASRTAMSVGGAVGDAVGSTQVDALISHLHTFTATGTAGDGGTGSPYNRAGDGGTFFTSAFNTSNVGGNETRPKNATVIYCVKY